MKNLRFFGDCAPKKWPLRGSFQLEVAVIGICSYAPKAMPDQLSALYSDLLEGSYDCVDRVILNAYFSMGQSGGGLRVWWRALYGSDENLDDNHLMRMAGRFSRRLRAWAEANKTPVVYSFAR